MHDHPGATVTDLATRRRGDDVLNSVTLVFEGVHYGTFPVRARYPKGKPMVLYVVPSHGPPGAGDDDAVRGPVDCLITDDPALALAHEAVR
jgi:hypothetical protein